MCELELTVTIPGATNDRLAYLQQLCESSLTTTTPRTIEEAHTRIVAVLEEHLKAYEEAEIDFSWSMSDGNS